MEICGATVSELGILGGGWGVVEEGVSSSNGRPWIDMLVYEF